MVSASSFLYEHDCLGSTLSEVAQLTVLAKPLVVLHPVSQSAAVGGKVVFSVAAVGTLPMSYSWRFNGRVVTNVILNQSTCFWTMANVQLTNAGNYTVGITNRAGPASGLTSIAVLTVVEDRDGDGMADTWETANGFDPASPHDSALDADGDGVSNLQEHLTGTDPNSRENFFQVDRIRVTPEGNSEIEFQALAGKTYFVEYQQATPAGDWNLLEEVTAHATNRIVRVVDGAAGSGPQRFYRLGTPRVR